MPRTLLLNLGTLALVLLISVAPRAHARECAGVEFPETIQVQGTPLHLNGLGLREVTVFDVDVFVAALYVKNPSDSTRELLSRDEPARMVMHFVRSAGAKRIIQEMDLGYRNNAPEVSDTQKKQFFAWMEDVTKGQAMTFTYVPGQGIEMVLAGRTKGTIPGPEFARGTLATLIGPNVVDEDLRAGLLGGRCK